MCNYGHSLHELGVCWNDAFRSIFHLNRWESVKLIQYFCGKMDIFHYYDLQHWKFLSSVCIKRSLIVFACILFDCILLFLLFIFCSALVANKAIYCVFLHLNCAVLFIARKIVPKRFDQQVVRIHKTCHHQHILCFFRMFDTSGPTVVSSSGCLQQSRIQL